MRGRLSLALAATTCLFLLEGLNVLMATLFATASAALHPTLRPIALLPALVPLAALLAPMLPLSPRMERRDVIAAAALVAAAARVLMCLPHHYARLVTGALVVAAGGIFLFSAVGFLERRSVAGGLAAAITIDQLARLAGWSWDITLRDWWILPQLAISIAVAAIALAWLRLPAPDPSSEEPSLERRAGGLRLRGGIALGLLLFLDLNVLARAEVAARWLGIRYEAAAVLLIGAGAIATLLLLAGHGPLGRGRRSGYAFTLFITVTVVAARGLAQPWAVVLFMAGHAMALLLIGRVLVPAGGRRSGVTLTAGWAAWLGLGALYAFTFFPAFTVPGLAGGAAVVFGVAGVLLFLLVALLPRTIETSPPLRGRLAVALILVGVLSAAGLLAIRPRPRVADTPVTGTLDVVTFNVHHGFDDDWRYDPARIARALAAADADVVALQEVGAGLPMAYGTDLVLYLARRFPVRAVFGATHNGLMGDALLTAVAGGTRVVALPAAGVEPKVAIMLETGAGGDGVRLVATRLGLSPAEQLVQGDSVLALLRTARRAVLVGDLNAAEASPLLDRVHAAGFADAFSLAEQAPLPTAPSARPERRIDWVLVRGIGALAGTVSGPAGSDHRMVSASLRVD
jgi:vancomycin resistance protein VanJ